MSIERDKIKIYNSGLLSDIFSKHQNILDANEKKLRDEVGQEISSGLELGKPYSKVIKAIEERFDVTNECATRITYDQMHTEQMKVRNEGFKAAQAASKRLGLKTYKVWKYNPITIDSKPDHMEMDGKAADENGIFTLSDGTKTEAPGLTGDPKHDSGCCCTCLFNIKGLD